MGFFSFFRGKKSGAFKGTKRTRKGNGRTRRNRGIKQKLGRKLKGG